MPVKLRVSTGVAVVTIQEFANGGKLYLGGWEAAVHATEEENLLGINCIVECRDGASEFQGRGHHHHTVVAPAGVLHLKVPATRLSQWIPRGRAYEAYEPVFEALGQGRVVLAHCLNGRHRSAQVCAGVMIGALNSRDPEEAFNYIWLRRRIVEWHALPGPPQVSACSHELITTFGGSSSISSSSNSSSLNPRNSTFVQASMYCSGVGGGSRGWGCGLGWKCGWSSGG